MKRFQELLSNDNQNQYGLQYKPIKGSTLTHNMKNNKDCDETAHLEKVYVYLKSNIKKPMRIQVEKKCKMQKLKKTIEQKMEIQFHDQIIYLNGRQISSYSSITFNQKQILHVSSRKAIVTQNQKLTVNLKISMPIESLINNKTLSFQLFGKDLVKNLENLISQLTTLQNPQNIFQFNFLQSGRILLKDKSFTNNNLTNNCDIVCLLSQNQVETKFINEFEDIIQEKRFFKKQNIDHLDKNSEKSFQQLNKNIEVSSQSLKFKKISINPANSNKFIIDKQKNKSYTRIQRKSVGFSNQYIHLNMSKRKSDSDSMVNGFKKKKHYDEEYDSEDSHLLRKIVVHKSKEQVQKICSESSILKEEVQEEEEEKKSVVSSSSEQKEKEYIPIRQQKEYRPCPLIPQRKMAQSEKLKINLELQKLFGLEPKTNILSNNQAQSNPVEDGQQKEQEATKSRPMMRNTNMRSSISAKESMLKMLKDRKTNRYAEQKMYEGD